MDVSGRIPYAQAGKRSRGVQPDGARLQYQKSNHPCRRSGSDCCPEGMTGRPTLFFELYSGQKMPNHALWAIPSFEIRQISALAELRHEKHRPSFFQRVFGRSAEFLRQRKFSRKKRVAFGSVDHAICPHVMNMRKNDVEFHPVCSTPLRI